jgi:hypothetical protein
MVGILKSLGCTVSERGVDSGPIVEGFDVLENSHVGLISRGDTFAIDAYDFVPIVVSLKSQA